MKIPGSICVKRCHGLGNVILLIPVLDYFHVRGCRICLVTRNEWVQVLSTLRPHFAITTKTSAQAIDLDELTLEISPSQHRTDEFARLLGLNTKIASPCIEIPSHWSVLFEHLAGSIILAPEATHPSRRWPVDYCSQIKELLPKDKLVLVGTEKRFKIACDVDLRGQLDLVGLFGVISISKVIITMDSAVLHIASSMKKAAVAIFGGVDFRYRIRDDQPVVVIQSKMACCPCNKAETCGNRYDCIKSIKPEHVLQAVSIASHTKKLLNFFDCIGKTC